MTGCLCAGGSPLLRCDADDNDSHFRVKEPRETDRTAERVARYEAGLSYPDLSPTAVHCAKRSLIDSVGCAYGALNAPPVKAVRSLASTTSSGPIKAPYRNRATCARQGPRARAAFRVSNRSAGCRRSPI